MQCYIDIVCQKFIIMFVKKINVRFFGDVRKS